jgi:hypothetical protein
VPDAPSSKHITHCSEVAEITLALDGLYELLSNACPLARNLIFAHSGWTHAPQHEARLGSVVRVMQPIVWGFLLMSRYANTRVALAMSAAATVDTHPTD